MHSHLTKAVAFGTTLAMAGIAAAQNPEPTGTYLGLEAGAYFPTNRTIRDVFGSTLPRIGINFINNRRPEKFKPQINFAVLGASKSGNRFLAIPVTVGVGQQFGGPLASARPYWRVGAGVAYLDYSIDVTGLNRISNTAFGFTANAEVGVLLSDRVRLSAAYHHFSKQDDFDFSGWEAKISFLFWRL